MDKEEYTQRLRDMDDALQQAKILNQRNKEALANLYALANNTIQQGDIIEGNGYIMLVKKITTCKPFFEDYPTCVYTGELLKKNLKSSKVQDPNAKIYQRSASIVKKAEK